MVSYHKCLKLSIKEKPIYLQLVTSYFLEQWPGWAPYSFTCVAWVPVPGGRVHETVPGTWVLQWYVPSRTQIQSHVPGTSCMKIGYSSGFWYAVPRVWVHGRYNCWTIYLSLLFGMSQFAKFEVQNFKN